MPLVSIGGLNLTGSKAFFEAGAESAAVVTDLALNDAPKARTREWIEDRTIALGREPHVLVVVGSDPGGGAGIAREIETIACLDVRTCLCCQRADGANPGRRLGNPIYSTRSGDGSNARCASS
ncbi:hypothetical protein NKH54_26420 [Mesorhizobium sp. M1004]